MERVSRLRWHWGAVALCAPWFPGAALAQRAPAPEPTNRVSSQGIPDWLEMLPKTSAARQFGVFASVSGVAQDRGVPSKSPGRAPSKLDFNQDTMADLLFQNLSTSELVYWLMDGDRLMNYGYINPSKPGMNWAVAGSGDFSGTGKTDLVLQATDTGDLIYWRLDGPNQIDVQYFTPRNPGLYWDVVSAADINRDGSPDLVFQNRLTGDIFIWYMHGTTMIAGAYINPKNPGSGWKVAAVGDLNGDGYADFVFQKKVLTPDDSAGAVYVWYMQTDTQIGGGFLNPANPGAGWNVAGLVDFLGQGRPQILFQNAGTGDLAYWIMDGLNLVRYDFPKPNNPGRMWKLVGSK